MNTFTILVSAFNEGNNIGSLIDDILTQELGNSLILEQIVVISDGSTDATKEMVETRIVDDSRVQLLVNPERVGQIASVNMGMREVHADFLVLLDGDVRLKSRHTLRNLLEGIDADVGLIGGNPVPASMGHGITALVSRCGDILNNNILLGINDGNNIFSAHGAIMALSRSYYSTLEIPLVTGGKKMVSGDQYLYLFCIKQNMKYIFRANAEVVHGLPVSFKEYLRKSLRFMVSFNETQAFFDNADIAMEYYIPLRTKVIAFANLCFREPVGALAWTLFRSIGHIILLARRFGLKWLVGD